MSVRVASSFGTVGMEEASLMFSTAMATRFFGLAPAAVVRAVATALDLLLRPAVAAVGVAEVGCYG